MNEGYVYIMNGKLWKKNSVLEKGDNLSDNFSDEDVI
jgi:hypothetical protein